MRLHSIISHGGSNTRKHRVGRGRGSGRGKTSGRGGKGQRARAGYSQRPGFESGHVPLYRKLPKRGFNNFNFRVEYDVVNVGDFKRVAGTEVDRAALVKAGLLRSNAGLLKILGRGDLDRPVTVKADAFSDSAKEKITKAGGQAVLLAPPAAEK